MSTPSSTTPIVVQPKDIVSGPRRAAASRRRLSADRRRERAREEAHGPVNVRLWIPSTLIFALLAPFAMLLTPFLYLTPRNILPHPARTIAGVGALLLAMGGTVVEVDAPGARVHIRLF